MDSAQTLPDHRELMEQEPICSVTLTWEVNKNQFNVLVSQAVPGGQGQYFKEKQRVKRDGHFDGGNPGRVQSPSVGTNPGP